MAPKRFPPRTTAKHNHEKCERFTELFNELQKSERGLYCAACTNHSSFIEAIRSFLQLRQVSNTARSIASQHCATAASSQKNLRSGIASLDCPDRKRQKWERDAEVKGNQAEDSEEEESDSDDTSDPEEKKNESNAQERPDDESDESGHSDNERSGASHPEIESVGLQDGEDETSDFQDTKRKLIAKSHRPHDTGDGSNGSRNSDNEDGGPQDTVDDGGAQKDSSDDDLVDEIEKVARKIALGGPEILLAIRRFEERCAMQTTESALALQSVISASGACASKKDPLLDKAEHTEDVTEQRNVQENLQAEVTKKVYDEMNTADDTVVKTMEADRQSENGVDVAQLDRYGSQFSLVSDPKYVFDDGCSTSPVQQRYAKSIVSSDPDFDMNECRERSSKSPDGLLELSIDSERLRTYVTNASKSSSLFSQSSGDGSSTVTRETSPLTLELDSDIENYRDGACQELFGRKLPPLISRANDTDSKQLNKHFEQYQTDLTPWSTTETKEEPKQSIIGKDFDPTNLSFSASSLHGRRQFAGDHSNDGAQLENPTIVPGLTLGHHAPATSFSSNSVSDLSFHLHPPTVGPMLPVAQSIWNIDCGDGIPESGPVSFDALNSPFSHILQRKDYGDDGAKLHSIDGSFHAVEDARIPPITTSSSSTHKDATDEHGHSSPKRLHLSTQRDGRANDADADQRRISSLSDPPNLASVLDDAPPRFDDPLETAMDASCGGMIVASGQCSSVEALHIGPIALVTSITQAATQSHLGAGPFPTALVSNQVDPVEGPDTDEQSNLDVELPAYTGNAISFQRQKRLPGLFKKAPFNAPLIDHIGAALQLLLKFAQDGHSLNESERSSVYAAVRRRLDSVGFHDEDGWTMEFWASYLAKADSMLKKSSLDRFLCLVGFHQSYPDLKTKNSKFHLRFESEFFYLPANEKKKLKHKLNTQNGWGEKLLVLIETYGMGILLTPNIWSILKGAKHVLQAFINDIELADPEIKVLLRLLEPQVEAIQRYGKADYEQFWSSIRSTFGADVWQQLKAQFAPDKALHIPDWILTNSVNTLIDHYQARLQVETSSSLAQCGTEDAHAVFMYNGACFQLDDLKYLHYRTKFSNFLILAAMNLAKPDHVIIGPSVEVHPARIQTRILFFKTWIKTIEADRNRGKDSHGLYLCPIWHKKHFSLLEINDSIKKILLYDTAGRNNSTNDPVLKRIKLDFVDMIDKGFEIQKMPCPQQSDDTSCGPLVVRMAIQRMNGREVGGWDDPVIPARVRMEIVELFDRCKNTAEIRAPKIIPLLKQGTPDVVEVIDVFQGFGSHRKRKGDDELNEPQMKRKSVI